MDTYQHYLGAPEPPPSEETQALIARLWGPVEAEPYRGMTDADRARLLQFRRNEERQRLCLANQPWVRRLHRGWGRLRYLGIRGWIHLQAAGWIVLLIIATILWLLIGLTAGLPRGLEREDLS